jgi:hypothetical protein
MSDHAPATLPSTITCRGAQLVRRDIKRDYVEYFAPGLRIVFVDGLWSGIAIDRFTRPRHSWQEVVRDLERRPLGERVSAGLLRAWRWVREVANG